MRVVVALEKRLEQTPDGRTWAVGWLDSSFWKRYLEVFDEVRVVARVRRVPKPPLNAKPADGPNVSFFPLPYYVGPWQFARGYSRLRRAVRQAVSPDDAVILRVPGQIGTLVERSLRKTGHPFAVEVVGDPQDVFSAGQVGSILRPLFRRYFSSGLRRQCAAACAAAYVTEEALQRRYPPGPDTFHVACSDIDMSNEAFVAQPRTAPSQARRRIVFVGSLEQLYKAPDVLIEALALTVRRGSDVELTIVGDGKHRRGLKELAETRGIGGRVRFTGALPAGEAVRGELDRADLFVLPSRTEGLPRALLEAMARALPCIATRVGGVPELLGDDNLVPPGDRESLATKIRDVLTDPDEFSRISAHNLARARDFHAGCLQPRRKAFYTAVSESTRHCLVRAGSIESRGSRPDGSRREQALRDASGPVIRAQRRELPTSESASPPLPNQMDSAD